MCLHLTDVQWGHSTSTQGKAPLVTVRWEMFWLWLFFECSVMSHFQNKHSDFGGVKKRKASPQPLKLPCQEESEKKGVFVCVSQCVTGGIVRVSVPISGLCSLVFQVWSAQRTEWTVGCVLRASLVIQPMAPSLYVHQDTILLRAY